jgi:hypothetical protein
MKKKNSVQIIWDNRQKEPVKDLNRQYYKLACTMLSFAISESHLKDRKYISEYIKRGADYFLTTRGEGGMYDLCIDIISSYEEKYKKEEKKVNLCIDNIINNDTQ